MNEAERIVLISPRPISPDEFRPFGSVFNIPTGKGRWDIEHPPEPADREMNLFMTILGYEKTVLPHEVPKLERHRWTGQIWVPIDPIVSLVVVAADNGRGHPDTASATAFTVDPGRGVTYNANTWHMPATVLGSNGRMSMTMWMDHRDHTELVSLASPIVITD